MPTLIVMTEMRGHAEESGAELEQGSLEHIRNMRAYRHQVARLLVELAAGIDPATASGIMKDITTASLDSVPRWCLTSDAYLRQLIRITGALFTAPTLRQCIEGRQLIKWRQLLGDALFDEVLEAIDTLPHSNFLPVPQASESLLFENGASILLSTLDGHPARSLLQERVGGFKELVDRQMSIEIYTVASGIHRRLQDTVNNTVGEGKSVGAAGAMAAGAAP